MFKRRIKLKRFVIHILSVPAINADVFDLSMDKNAVIICTDRTSEFIEGDYIKHKLILPFQDVEIKNMPGAFNEAYARSVIRFLQKLPDCVSDLYVCCSKGGSRSPALAAAILKGSKRSDDPVWKNPFYNPNKLVYWKMCKELGIFMPWPLVKHKGAINERAFKDADKDNLEYERWQILF